MTLHYGFESLPENLRTVVTVGSFDGVHAGHRTLLARLRTLASRLGAESVVVTFEPHPRIAMGRAEGMQLLTSVQERALLLGRYGVDRVVVVRFDQKFREQGFEEFVRGSLVAKLGMVGMVVGYNHRFGRGSEGNFESLGPVARELGFELERVEQYTDSGDKVSSTVVRGLMERGDVERAREVMGHGYIIMGRVEGGLLRVEDEYKLLPADGVYGVVVNGMKQNIEIRDREIVLNIDNQNVIIEI
jgi:riboflavin kinase/FMN adenylyltransferase